MGKMKTESQNSLEFIDEINNITAIINIGKVKKKPSDYFTGHIKVKN